MEKINGLLNDIENYNISSVDIVNKYSELLNDDGDVIISKKDLYGIINIIMHNDKLDVESYIEQFYLNISAFMFNRSRYQSLDYYMEASIILNIIKDTYDNLSEQIYFNTANSKILYMINRISNWLEITTISNKNDFKSKKKQYYFSKQFEQINSLEKLLSINLFDFAGGYAYTEENKRYFNII